MARHSTLDIEALRVLAAKGLTSHNIAEMWGKTENHVRTYARAHGIHLVNMTGPRKKKKANPLDPPPPFIKDGPVTPALERLAQFDSIARAALDRRLGLRPSQRSDEGDDGLK
jgi:hypothetical protein